MIAILGALLVLMSAGLAQAQSGTVTGRIATKDLPQGAAVVVSLEAPGLKITTPLKPVAIDQKKMQFLPQVVPVARGTTVTFLNTDSVQHNVFSPEGHYNLGSWRRGSREYTFAKPGVYTQLCRLHPDMLATVVVLDTPYFAAIDSTGTFQIADVPPGKYTLAVWSNKLKAASQAVAVQAGKRTAVVVTPAK